MATLGSTTITSLTVFNNTTLKGTLGVSGTSTFSGKTTHNAGIQTTTLSTSGNTTIGGTLGVTGTSTFSGKTTHSGIQTTFLNTSGDVAIGGKLSVTGTSTFTGAVTLSSVSSNIIPNTTESYTLGNTSKKWENLYAKHANITNSIIINEGVIKGSDDREIICCSDRFEIGKGVNNIPLWLHASDFKFSTPAISQAVIISSGGRVGIGNVGGAPVEKLHISDGYVIANGFKLWRPASEYSYGGKTLDKLDFSDSTVPKYVLLTNGNPLNLTDYLNETLETVPVGTAAKLGTNAGSSTNPVYFSGGVPVQCGTSLAVSITGNAATATKATTAEKLTTNATWASGMSKCYICGSATSASSGTSTDNKLYKKDTVYINSSSAIYAQGGFYESSDERLKTFINPINIDLEQLLKLRKSYFTFNTSPDKIEIGVSAQEIQKLYPEIINTDENGMLSVAYDKLSVIALAAVDKLVNKNKELEERLSKIENILSTNKLY